jgi:hypothetical protein
MNTRVFPVKVELRIVLTDGRGCLIRELPFRYTVNSPNHWGLLKLAYRTNGTRFVSSPTNKHFLDYAGTVANIVYSYMKDGDRRKLVNIHVVGPPVISGEDKHVYASDTIYQSTLLGLENNYKQGAFYVLRSLVMLVLRSAVTRCTSAYLKNAGYHPQVKPRKYIHARYQHWKNYRGVEYARIKRKLVAIVVLEENYTGPLLDLYAVREVLKYIPGVKRVEWLVNTEAQAIEAKLLVPNSEVLFRQ